MKYSRQILKSILISFIVVFFFSVFAFFYISNMDDVLEYETKNYLSEISEESKIAINSKLKSNLNELENISKLLEIEDKFDLEETLKILESYNKNSNYNNIGMILPNGKGYAKGIFGTDFSDRDYFKLAIKGTANISKPLIDKDTGKLTKTYAVPLYNNGKIVAVIAADYDVEFVSEFLSISTFNGEGFSLICDSNGEIIIPSYHKNSNSNITNLSQVNFKKIFTFKNMKISDKGVVEAKESGKEFYMAYTSLGINDWFIISVVPKMVVSKKLNNLMIITIIGWIILSFLFLGVILYILYSKAKSQKTIEKMAYTDFVTGYSNWRKFELDVRNLLKKASQNDKHAMVIFDIDKFKAINDIYGHKKGNSILKDIADTLDSITHNNETFARVSSDNFNMLLSYDTREDIINVIKKIIINNDVVNLSFGIYEIKDKSLSISAYSDRASLAKLSIKNNRDINFAFFNDELRDKLLLEDKIEKKMEYALENNQFIMYLQPKYNIKSEKFCGSEALVRWQYTEKEFIYPSDFIPIFEKNGFITKIDMYILEQACKEIRTLFDKGISPLPISVNFSRVDFFKKDFITKIVNICDKYKIPYSLIEIEITESSMFGDTDTLFEVSRSLQDIGFILSMDDFGSGYSSVNMLKNIPLNVIKLDRGFFIDDKNIDKSQIVIKSIVSLIKQLGIRVVAEGIETKSQVEMLRKANCDIIQGYYFSKPLPVKEFEKLVYKI
ncbi:EAL domain-containing protein [Clostridioides sp. ZZV14-6009]|nr:EAL domain-containing protein [Clostridioides sp. ZZV14-6153]MCC0723649.1 EAL domain-containing protein [Clostridioides sp. ZZV14-6104]MCC0728309.1 EAL domain-containing protein [Clostridioides sp. ZZV14-6045]MCC0734635.1 EAL domain-containing protein [Clostridioides sp. ZZV14-6009]MCC0738606.1 EAL domain-containing protein [Clostridioides sp. ZZV14-5902]